MKEKNWKVEADDVVILPGSLFGTVVAFRTILDPGDEALIPDPGFTNHFSQVELSGGRIKDIFSYQRIITCLILNQFVSQSLQERK